MHRIFLRKLILIALAATVLIKALEFIIPFFRFTSPKRELTISSWG
jgi:hypothetical protein